jgi:trans-aconitate 2-methyltransferase
MQSSAFHWVMNHDRMFSNLAAVMRRGAQLAAQCGGAGNLDRVGNALKAMGHDWPGTKNYITARRA